MDIVTTNLRIKRADWLQLKAMAAEHGLSFNEYVKRLLAQKSKTQLLNVETTKQIVSPSIWQLADISSITTQKKTPELSEEDQIIYG